MNAGRVNHTAIVDGSVSVSSTGSNLAEKEAACSKFGFLKIRNFLAQPSATFWEIRGYNLVRIALGSVVLAAALLKGQQLATGPVTGSSVFTSRWFLMGFVEFELVLGTWLLAGFYLRASWAAALTSFAVFAGVSLHRALAGESACGCFGRLEINPWHVMLFDLCAVFALLRWRPVVPPASDADRGCQRWTTKLCLCGIIACLTILAGLWMTSYAPTTINVNGEIVDSQREVVNNAELVVLEPAEWIGKRLPLLRHIDVAENLASGKWRVVLYHHDCAECRDAVPRYERLAIEQSVSDDGGIALIAVPPYAAPGAGLVSSQSPCLIGRLSDDYSWFVQTPTEILLKDAVVIGVRGQE